MAAPAPPSRPTSTSLLSPQPASYDRWVRGQLLFLHVKGSPLQKSLQPTKSFSFRFVSDRAALPLVSSRLLFLLCYSTYYSFHRGGELDVAGGGSTRGELTPSSAAMGSLGGGCQTELSDGGVRRMSRGWWAIYSPWLTGSLSLLQGPTSAARSGCRRWTWRSRSLRPRRHRSSRPPVRYLSPCHAASALAICVLLVVWLDSFERTGDARIVRSNQSDCVSGESIVTA